MGSSAHGAPCSSGGREHPPGTAACQSFSLAPVPPGRSVRGLRPGPPGAPPWPGPAPRGWPPRFSDLRVIKDAVKTRFAGHPNVDMGILSMGMSSDYKIAIEEGSTMVRVGSAIFKRHG